MAEWFLGCYIDLDVPIERDGENWFTTIANYPADPGFQVGEIIQFVDVSLTKEQRNGKRIRTDDIPRFTFEGLVKQRLKVVRIDNTITTANGSQEVLDTLELIIRVEIADKERVPEIREHIESFQRKVQSQE